MSNEALKPCPFCNGAAICDPWPVGIGAGQRTYYKVVCRQVISCCASGGAFPTESEAIAAWNRRAASPVAADTMGDAKPERSAMFDAFGRQRVRYVRVIHDGTTCVVSPGDIAAMVDSERPDDYRTEDVYLSKEEFDALPEFDGF